MNLMKLSSFPLSLFAFVFFQAGYAQQRPEKIRINPDAAMGGTVSHYIDKVQFITFESNAQSAFGNIDQLEITDKYYIILDQETAAILIFDKQGQFHAKIEGRAMNPQNPVVYEFNFDKKTKLIKIQDQNNVFFYDLDGKLIMHTKRSSSQYLGVEGSLGDAVSAYYYAGARPDRKAGSLAYELMVTEGGKLVKGYLPYSMPDIKSYVYDSWGAQSHADFYSDYIGIDSVLYYSREFDYNIYRLTPHTMHSAYEFILPVQMSLPDSFKTDSTFYNKKIKYIKAHPSTIFKILNFYRAGDWLFFKTLAYGVRSPTYIYNTKSQALVCVNKIISDASSYYLPITDAEIGGLDFVNHSFIQVDGDNFYSYSSLALFYQMQATKNKHPDYPPSLVNYFSDKRNAKGNPVLIQIKFKPNF